MNRRIRLAPLEHTLLLGDKTAAELPDLNGNLPLPREPHLPAIPPRRLVSIEEFEADMRAVT